MKSFISGLIALMCSGVVLAEDFTIYAIPVKSVSVGYLAMRQPYNYNQTEEGSDLQIIFIETGRLSKKSKSKWVARIEAGGSVIDNKWTGSIGSTLGLTRTVDIHGSHYWVGIDAVDAAYQSSQTQGIPDYVQARTSLYIGRVFKVGKKCAVEIYGVAGMGWYDNLTYGEQEAGRPLVGSRGAMQCKGATIAYDVDHVFSYGEGDTTQFEVDTDYTFQFKDSGFRVGLFANFEDILRNSPAERDGVTVPYLRDYVIELTGGVRVKF